MKNLISFFYHCLLLACYPLSFLFPRRSNQAVLTSGNNSFAGNPKHLYYNLLDQNSRIKPIWITKNRTTFQNLKDKSLPVAYYYSLKGIYACLSAKYYFYNMSLSDLNFYASGGAIKINLWHGTPIKLIGRDAKKIQTTSSINSRIKKTFKGLFSKIKNRIFHPYHYVSPDYFTSSSKFTTEKIFESAIGLKREQYLEMGYPRSDLFFKPLNHVENFIQQYESDSIKDFIQDIRKFDKIYFYLPTYRDSERDFLTQATIDLEYLNGLMQKQNGCFIFKMHPKTTINLEKISHFSHLKVLYKEADIYTIMPFTDVLVTDYSSVYFDYLLLEKEIILFPFDIEKYLKDSRELYFNFEEVMKGIVVFSFQELTQALSNRTPTPIDMKVEQERLRKLFWDDYRGDATTRIIDFLEKC